MITLDTRKEQQEIDALAIKLFEEGEPQFTPTHPWVFVRVMPREQFTGTLWLPDTKQNKPVHEGLVLSTWQSFTKHWREKHNGEWIDCQAEIKTDFNIGDHVTYPWSAGMPAPGWDERYYRLVPEHVREQRGINSSGIIFGTLDYPQKSIKEELKTLIDDEEGMYYDDAASLVDLILGKFDIVRKTNLYSRTTSGK